VTYPKDQSESSGTVRGTACQTAGTARAKALWCESALPIGKVGNGPGKRAFMRAREKGREREQCLRHHRLRTQVKKSSGFLFYHY
jgi:hypothetical protein